MSPYEQRLQHDLDEIRHRVAEVSELVRTGLQNAVQALLTEDRALANATVLGDLPINRAIREIDRKCHGFVARHLPSAGHLRFVSSVLRLTIGIERIGDYAATIGREVSQLQRLPPSAVIRDIELLAEQSLRMFPQAIRAFLEGDADLARSTKVMESQVDRSYDKVFADLLEEGDGGETPTRELFAVLSVFNVLERVSDQAKNICEETIFAVEGKTKSPKKYSVLFLDEKNDCASQMAAAFSHKNYPNSLAAHSSGWNPARFLDSGCQQFLVDTGLDLEDAAPRALVADEEELSRYHIIVGLQSGAAESIPRKPFHTTYLEWDLVGKFEHLKDEESASRHEALYKMLASKIRELAELLRGEEAD